MRAFGGIGFGRIRFGRIWLARSRVGIVDARAFAPDRLVVAIAPVAWPVERVHAEPIEPRHFMDPARMHPIGMIVRGVADFGKPDFAVESVFGDVLGLLPHVRFVDLAEVLTLASEGELTGQMPIGILINDTADVVWIVA